MATNYESLKYPFGIFDSKTNYDLYYYNRFKFRNPNTVIEHGGAYVFFTQPDMNFFGEEGYGTVNADIANRPEFSDYLQTNPELFKMLKTGAFKTKFIPILMSHAQNFDEADVSMKVRHSGETCNSYKITYNGKITESLADGTFSITYSDDRDTPIYKLHQIWVSYMDLIHLGYLSPTRRNRQDKVLDYACSVFYFVVGEDGETIIYFSKYYGVFPINIPSSSFSFNGQFKSPELNIQYQYSFRESPNPLIIKDFNKISLSNNRSFEKLPMYDDYNRTPGPTNASNVFVEKVTNEVTGRFVYKLKFAK